MNNLKGNKKELSPNQREELVNALRVRLEKDPSRHKGLAWAKVQARCPPRWWDDCVASRNFLETPSTAACF